MLSSQYGWTTDYILTRTVREISWLIKKINCRMVDKLKLEASLHGMEYRPRQVYDAPLINDERRELVEKAIAMRQGWQTTK